MVSVAGSQSRRKLEKRQRLHLKIHGGNSEGYYLDMLALPRDPGPSWQPSEAAIY